MSIPNRTLCECLEEMRGCAKTLNFAPILGLVHEIQILANRMESALHDKNDLNYYRDKLRDLKKEIKELKKEKEELEEVVGKVPEKKREISINRMMGE